MADRRLQVFHAVARHLSFTKAAEALFMTQPAVTFQIKQLEEQYSTRLFDRGHGRIALTPAGQMVLGYAERILGLSAELDTRMKELTGQVAGTLLVGASMTIAEFMLPPVLGEFRARHPRVMPQLAVANTEAIENRVAERTLDLGFVEGPVHSPGVLAEPCGEDELMLVCAPSHPLARLAAVPARELAGYPMLSRERGSGTREVVDEYLRAAGIDPESLDVAMEMGSLEALKGLAATGIGFTVMSRAATAKETQLGQLVRLPLAPRLTRTLSVVTAKERFRTRLVAAFVEFVRPRLPGAQ